MTRIRKHGCARRHHFGFTLIELLVGMAIGMFATIIIVQVMSVFSAQRRTTSGSANAQTNGNIALSTMVRDLQQAGYPLFPSADSPLECNLSAADFGSLTQFSLTPASITNGVATSTTPASDSITITYGNSATGGTPAEIINIAGAVADLGSNLGCKVNDISLVSLGSSCKLSKVTAVSAVGGGTPTVTLQDSPGLGSKSNLSCLGTWTQVTYAVNAATGNLDRSVSTNGGAAVVTPSVVGVVNLQAQYGVATSSSSNTIAQWVDASGGTWAAPTNANRNRIKAIRIAVVTRNEQVEGPNVTSACSSTTTKAVTGPETTGLCAWTGSSTSPAPTIDLSPGNPQWRQYRYRVFDTIIPLRNVIWAKGTL